MLSMKLQEKLMNGLDLNASIRWPRQAQPRVQPQAAAGPALRRASRSTGVDAAVRLRRSTIDDMVDENFEGYADDGGGVVVGAGRGTGKRHESLLVAVAEEVAAAAAGAGAGSLCRWVHVQEQGRLGATAVAT